MSNNFILPNLNNFEDSSKKLGNKNAENYAEESKYSKKEKKQKTKTKKEKSMFTNKSKLFLIAFIIIAIIVIIILYFKNKDSDSTKENIRPGRGSENENENRKNATNQETRIIIPDNRKGILKRKTDKECPTESNDDSGSVEDLGSIDDNVVINMEKTIDDDELIKYIED